MRYQRQLALAGGLLLVGACQAAHNDVLVFGTSTKLAIDATATPANAGIPEITVGYKRQEAVWLPLIVNGGDSTVDQKPAGNDAKYMGSSDGSGGIHNAKTDGTKNDQDAYSVFASFGANFGAKGGTGSAEASGGIAQFFATGIAAQRLGANARVAEALKVESTSAQTQEALKGQAAAEKARADAAAAQAAFYSDLTPEQFAAIKKRGEEGALRMLTEDEANAECALPQGADSRAQAFIDEAKKAEATAANIETGFISAAAQGRAALADYLAGIRDNDIREGLNTARNNLCPTQ